ncbi:hypothetical protein LCGC14_0864690 [marine sediment metagenome]|uniref:Uncharacterized protein n=1 Tax=marine sediment metagenome TaxID=412755 RepID=A0A0F9SDI6_9ZZZZ
MATRAQFLDGTYGSAWNTSKRSLVRFEIWRNQISFTTLSASINDVFQAIQVPADTWIMHAWLRVITACATGVNGDLGYGSDPDKWGQFLKLTATGVISGQHQESSGGGIVERGVNEPFHFSSDDTIDLKLNKAATSGVVEVCALALRSK